MMKKDNKDVFNSFLVSEAEYAGNIEIPCVSTGIYMPKKLISFSKAISTNDQEAWVHFYEHDYMFERLWRNPQKYLPVFRRYDGVISPDFSLYRNMPLVMQYWNIYRSRAIAVWLQKNGIKVIPNVRYGDRRTYDTACLGIQKNGTIAVGSHGNIKNPRNRKILCEGFNRIVDIIEPQIVVVYGTVPSAICDKCELLGITLLQYESEYAASRKEVV